MIDLTEKVKSIRLDREREFALSFFKHDKWDHEPRYFRLSDGTRYLPDFRDNMSGEFIEVIGTRQAFHRNKKKYLKFFEEYPGTKLSFYLHTGEKAEVFGKRADLSMPNPWTKSYYTNYSYPTTRCNYDLRFFRKQLDAFFIQTRWTYGMFYDVAGAYANSIDSVLGGRRPYCGEKNFHVVGEILQAYKERPSDFVKIENKFSVPIKNILERKARKRTTNRHFYYPGLPFKNSIKFKGGDAA